MIAVSLFRRPQILLLSILVVLAAGVSSWFVLPQLEDPVLSRRVGLILAVYPGASAAEVESLVTIPLEEKVRGIAKVKRVRSNSQRGTSNVVVELQDNVYDVDPVWSVVRDRIAELAESLPQEASKPALNVVPLKAYAAIIAVSPGSLNKDSDDSLESRLTGPARELRRKLLAVNGTESADLFGDSGEEVAIEIEPARLATLETSAVSVARQIEAQMQSLPSGSVRQGDTTVPVQVINDSNPIDQLKNVVIRDGNGQLVRLSEVCEIRRQPRRPQSQLALIDGRPSIVLGVSVSDSVRVDSWWSEVKQVLDQHGEEQDGVVAVETLFSQARHISQRMKALLSNLTLGIVAVTVVVFVLMGWRSMLVVASVLPLSSLMVLGIMRVLGIPIHQMSVTGLIVALGLLIDNAIVMVEDIRLRLADGRSLTDSMTSSVRHLRMPLFGSTLTTALAFLPIATLPGPPGEFVGSIAISVILAIASSFGLAMTVVPAMFCLLHGRRIRSTDVSSGVSIDWLRRLYESSLKAVFNRPLAGVVLGIILPTVGFLASSSLPEEFFPPSDRAQIQIEVEQSAQSSLAATRQVVDEITVAVGKEPGVTRQHWFVGGSAPTFYYNVVPRRRNTPFYAQAFVDLQPQVDSDFLVRTLQRRLNSDFPSSRIVVRRLNQGPPFDAPVEVRLSGPDILTLQDLGAQLRVLLTQSRHVLHTRSDMMESLPRIEFNIDEDVAANAGLTSREVGLQVYSTLQGAAAGSVSIDGQEIPVAVRVRLDDKRQFQQIEALPLFPLSPPIPKGPPGQTQPALTTLRMVATPTTTADVGAIVRVDGQRVNEVKAYITAGVLPAIVISDFRQRLSQSGFTLPDGYEMTFGGESEKRSDAVNSLMANGVALFLLMLLTLVLSFMSFRCAGIIAAVGSLSIGLGPLALLLFGFPFGFMAIVGTMGLVGIAINDSIVVLAAIRSDDKARSGNREALVRVISHSTRHIIATTVTTMVGFLPLILEGGRFWPPLAITIACGVGGATLLALYMVPALHILVFRAEKAASITI